MFFKLTFQSAKLTHAMNSVVTEVKEVTKLELEKNIERLQSEMEAKMRANLEEQRRKDSDRHAQEVQRLQTLMNAVEEEKAKMEADMSESEKAMSMLLEEGDRESLMFY